MNKYIVMFIIGLLVCTSIISMAQPQQEFQITREELNEFESIFWKDNWKYIYRYRIMGIQTPRFMELEQYVVEE